MTKYELNPRKIAFRALQIQDKVFDNGGISMMPFSDIKIETSLSGILVVTLR